jgi:hypothetical protein
MNQIKILNWIHLSIFIRNLFNFLLINKIYLINKLSRPESSFLAFTNPIKSLKVIIWRRYKWWIITSLFILFLIAFALLMCYTLPVNQYFLINL